MDMNTQDMKMNLFKVISFTMIGTFSGIIGVVLGVIFTEHFDKKRTAEEMSYKLMRSAYECDFREARWLIEDKADVNTKSKSGFTPLHWVAWGDTTIRGCKTIAEQLIQSGANVNDDSNSGLTPLHLAAQSHYRAMVILLLCNGAQINAENKKLKTPLHLAIEQKYDEDDRDSTVKELVRAGANLELKDENGKTLKALFDNDEKWNEFLAKRVDTHEYLNGQCSKYKVN